MRGHRRCPEALLPLWEKGWDEGYSACRAESLQPLTPTPLPQGERG
ncbi:hypothetical protein [Azospirillum doebereinerae]